MKQAIKPAYCYIQAEYSLARADSYQAQDSLSTSNSTPTLITEQRQGIDGINNLA